MPTPASPSYDTERAQARVRLIISGLASLYVAMLSLGSYMPETQVRPILIYVGVFLGVSLLLLLDIVRRPGVRPARRLFAMLHDYTAITFTMVIGGEALLPVYGALVWVTVGNGLRYGSGYLAVATACALLSLVVTSSLSPYWQAQPYVVATLIMTALVVPAYANRLLAQTRRATEAEHAANLAKSRFLAQASHDLRQPIHSISLFTACLRDADLGAEAQRMVDNIDRSLYSVAQLFRSILDLYRLDGGGVTPRSEVVALQDVLADVVRQNAEAARWAGVSIRLRPTGQHVRVDPGLLATMLQNILSNALKYACGQPLLIGCRRRSGALAIEVYDKGRGIPAQHLANVFEEFYRVRQVRDRDIEGLGLGLAIVRRLGQLMHLEIRIRSVVGKGTAVAIEGLQPARAQELAPAPLRSSAPVRMLDGLRVFLIEDDRSALLATATLLEKWGCIVETSTSMPTGDVQCDLVITDFDMGTEASGADCIHYLRALNGRNIRAVVITGHEVKRVQESVGDQHIPILSKPVHPAELRSLLMALKLDMQPSP